MSDDVRYVEWRNSNERCKYPFSINATLMSDTAIIPENMLVDARLYPLGGSVDQYLSMIEKDGRVLRFTVADTESGDLAYGEFDQDNQPPRGVVHLIDRYDRSAGVFVTDEQHLLPLFGWADGEYQFTVDQTLFACTVITPMPLPAGLRSLRADDTTALTGDVYLIGGPGIALEAAIDGDNLVVTVHAVGEPLYKQLLCSDTGFTVPCKLKTINGVPPDEYGNFDIVLCGLETTKSLLRIEAVEHGIRITTAGAS